MKRIALLVCGMVLMVSSTAEARWTTWTNGGTYAQPVRVAPAAYNMRPAQPMVYTNTPTYAARPVQPVYTNYTGYANTAAYGTSTAQGVANLMASYNRVGHWGGNTGYEGCGAGATPAAAYHNCCYANSGMATVDVGYAQASNGMWYCCRRYR